MAYTAGTEYNSEFSGQKQILYVEVSPDAATGNITLSDWDYAVPVGYVFTEDLVATCYSLSAEQDGTTTNQINIKLWKAGGTAADTAYIDFRLALVVWNDGD